MSYAKLKRAIRSQYDNMGDFAAAMGISRSGLSMKLNGHTEWKCAEIRKAMELLKKPMEDVSEYFFTPKV